MLRLRLVMAVAGLVLTVGLVTAQAAGQAGRIYRLGDESTYQHGCFEGCACPLSEPLPIRGTFKLTPGGTDGWYDVYKVTDVNWTVSSGDPELRVTGSGEYRIGGPVALMHRLELDLVVGDNAVEHFDSGLIPGGFNFPEIDIVISINGIYCLDTVITIESAPVPPSEIRPYRLLPGTTYQTGCFPPCLCPIGPELPVVGRFALVKLQENPLFTEYAVVDVKWRVLSPVSPSSAGFPITGFGTYWVGGEVAIQHRLGLDLRVGHARPTHLDSGLVIGGTNFPRIDIVISENGIFCNDQVIDLHAAPSWSGLVAPAPAAIAPTP